MTVDRVFATVAEVTGDVQAGFTDRRHATGTNPTGDEQLRADVQADQLLADRLLALDLVASYTSEERPSVTASGTETGGQYHIACDPLDGSSNLASNNPAGTIIGVYDQRPPAPGTALLAAGYVLYGPVTTMVVAVDDGGGQTVTEYLLKNGERRVLDADVQLPETPTVYGLGGRVPDWPAPIVEYVDAIEADRLKLRYGGAMVADVNQVLAQGGVFGYPMLVDRPEGKLRAVFEALPMAYIMTAAGGAASDGTEPLLATAPDNLHERTPVFVGSEPLIERLEETLEQA
ncbi:MAG: fructose-1,6-bisphosphatase [halophilic archaeon J07HX5]|jgi:D-fructose 1,6-bisphosphatase (EC 3.1.3.11)|nr:MAG: fructose-1,6-bisphosphatase [halophilic archaeon J07HX5]